MSANIQKVKNWSWGFIALVIAAVLFILPFAFIFQIAMKDPKEANQLEFSWPKQWYLVENFMGVIQANDFMLLRAFINSTAITVGSVTGLVFLAAMAAWTIERRGGTLAKVANGLILAGLMIPPSVVPTIFIMQFLGIYGTFPGIIFIEIAYGTSFTVMIFKAFISSIPREIDEAATIDGAKPLRLFFSVIFPLLRSVIVTAIILNSVFIFNDFMNPLYFLAGEGSETVQLTLYNFTSQYRQDFGLLFMDILLITIPMVIMYAIFNKRIIAGMTAGSVKG